MLEFSKLIQTFSLRMTFAFIVFLETGGWIKAKRLKCWIESRNTSKVRWHNWKALFKQKKIGNKYLPNVTVKICIFGNYDFIILFMIYIWLKLPDSNEVVAERIAVELEVFREFFRRRNPPEDDERKGSIENVAANVLPQLQHDPLRRLQLLEHVVLQTKKIDQLRFTACFLQLNLMNNF